MKLRIPKISIRPLIRTLLVICLLLPVYTVVMKARGKETLLSINLMIFSLSVVCLFLLYRSVLYFRRRYPPPPAPTRLPLHKLDQDIDSARERIRGAGYRFQREGMFAEFGSLGRVAKGVLLGSLTLLLMTGVYDNLRYLSGVILIHTGAPFALYEKESYFFYGKGPMASFSEFPYKIKAVEMYENDSRYPLGAMKIWLMTKDEKDSWLFLLKCLGEGYKKDDFTILLNSLEYDIGFTVLINGNNLLYSDWIHLIPLKLPADSYTYTAELLPNSLNDVGGTALFDPVANKLKVRLRHTKKYVDFELGRAPEHEIKVENYHARIEGIARRGQVRISRDRHIKTLGVLACIALLSGFVVVCAPRRRVWITPGEDNRGCFVRGDDADLMASLEHRGE